MFLFMLLKHINFNVSKVLAKIMVFVSVAGTQAAWGAGFQPDLMVKLSKEPDGSYLGAGIYESYPSTQFKFQSVPTGKAASFRVLVRNAGDVSDTYALRGTVNGPGFSVSYLDQGGTDRSAEITEGSFRTPLLAPGESVTFQVEVTPSELPLGTTCQVTVGAYSLSDSGRWDRVALETVTCGSAPGVIITAPADASGGPGGTVTYPYRVTNVGNAPDRFDLTLKTSTGSSGVLVADDGAGGGIAGDGIRQAAEVNVIHGTGSLLSGESFRFFLVVTLPAGSTDGNSTLTTVNVTGTGASTSDQVTTTTAAPAVTVGESVRNQTQGGRFAATAEAVPGETLQYRMAVTNAGSAPALSLSLDSTLPAHTSLVPGSLRIGTSALGDADACSPSRCGTASEKGGEISAFLGGGGVPGSGGTLGAGDTLYVFFKVVLE